LERPKEGYPKESLEEYLEENCSFLIREDRPIEKTAVIALYELNLLKENLIELLNHNSNEYKKLKKENEQLKSKIKELKGG